MSIIRVRKDARYFSASNEPFNDERLSWESRGLMGYLLSKPDHWTVRTEDIEKKGPAGNRKVRRMLAELRQHGYMNRIRVTKEAGKFDWITEVYESPSQNPRKPSCSFSTSGSSTSGEPPHIVNTEEDYIYPKDAVITVLENLSGGLNSQTTKYVDTWREKHSDEWILKAVAMAKDKGANIKYADSILIGWEAKGYPKTREERVNERRGESKPEQNTPVPPPQIDPEKKLVRPEMFKRQHAGS